MEGKLDVVEEMSEPFTRDELQQFLEADDLGIEVDPVFKEQLRRKLWSLLRTHLGIPPEASSRRGGRED